MKYLSCVLTWLLVLAGCELFGEDPSGETSFVDALAVGQWEALDFPGSDVRRLELDPPYLYVAAGKDGLFRRVVHQNNSRWEHLGFADTTGNERAGVTDIDALGEDLLLSQWTVPSGAAVWRSPDGGESWLRANAGLLDSTCADRPRVIFALERSPHRPEIALASKMILFRSLDGGSTWTLLDFAFPPGPCVAGVHGNVYWNPQREGEAWEDDVGGIGGNTVLRSTDFGVTWKWTGLDLFVVSGVTFDTEDPNVIYVGHIDGLLNTTDGGATWQEVLPEPAVRAVTAHPSVLDLLYAVREKHIWSRPMAGRRFGRSRRLPPSVCGARRRPMTGSSNRCAQRQPPRYTATKLTSRDIY